MEPSMREDHCAECSGMQATICAHGREIKTLFVKVDAIGTRLNVILGGVVVTLVGVVFILLMALAGG